jgi:hypothetical protein
MTYEHLQSTRAINVHCVCCGRPLRDATSVERAIGPDCAEKHGVDVDASRAPDWTRFATALARLPRELRVRMVGLGAADCPASTDARRKLANVLTWALADSDAPMDTVAKGAAVVAIHAIGFVNLARAIAKAAKAVEVTLDAATNLYIVKAPYSETLTEAMRRVPGSRWDGERKVRTVPVASRLALWTALESALVVGTPVIGATCIKLVGVGAHA